MAEQELKEDDIVLCTVKKVEGTTVYLDIEDNGSGTMVFSEVSPGRIRNIRQYVAPNKVVVCKVLRMKHGHPELSLRRVTAGERDEMMDRYKKSKIVINMIKPILKDKTQSIIESIKKDYDLADFLDEARENPDLLEKYIPKEHAAILKRKFIEKREKEKEVREKIRITSTAPSGLKDIQDILGIEDAEIHYLGSSKFVVSVKADDYKKANAHMDKILESMREKAKEVHAKLEARER